MNAIMESGKKSTAESICYGAFEILKQKTGSDPLKVFKTALENAKPVLEVKPRRVGGATYQVPVEIRPHRRTALAFRWIINYSRARAKRRCGKDWQGNSWMRLTIRVLPLRKRKIPTKWPRLIRLLPIIDGRKKRGERCRDFH